MSLIKKSLLIPGLALLGSVFVGQGCGRAKTTQADKKSEQPADVAGGFGLTCLVANNNYSDELQANYQCTYRDKDGNKFIDRSDLAVKPSVKSGDKEISVTLAKKEHDYSFRFWIPWLETDAVRISSTFVNPQDGDKVVLQMTAEVKDVPSWLDVTLNAENKPSTCKDCPANCTMTFANKNDPRIWFRQSVIEGVSAREAQNACSTIDHNFEPNTSIGATAWRPANSTELKRLFELQRQFAEKDRWIKVDQTSYWASISIGEGKSTVLVANSGELKEVAGTEKHSAICVLPRISNTGEPFLWSDITTSSNGGASDCNSTPERCTKRNGITKLWWSATQSPSDGMTWSEGKAHCSGLLYNGQTGWRLPTMDEIRMAARTDVVFYGQHTWISDSVMRKNIWSSDYSTENVDAYFVVLAKQCPVVSSSCSVQRAAGTGWMEPVAKKNAVVCVRPE